MSVREQKLKGVEAEIARERAESLGRSTRRLQGAIDSLHRFDAGSLTQKSREQLVAEAAEACLAYLVQREFMGFGAQDAVSIRKDFAVPMDVWSQMGAVRSA